MAWSEGRQPLVRCAAFIKWTEWTLALTLSGHDDSTINIVLGLLLLLLLLLCIFTFTFTMPYIRSLYYMEVGRSAVPLGIVSIGHLLKSRPSPHTTMPNLVVIGQAVWVYVRRSTGKKRVSHVPPFKVIKIDMDPSASCDILQVIHTNHEPILYCFEINGDFGQISQLFLLPVYLYPFEFCSGGRAKENDSVVPTRWEKCLKIRKNPFDTMIGFYRQTDRQTDINDKNVLHSACWRAYSLCPF